MIFLICFLLIGATVIDRRIPTRQQKVLWPIHLNCHLLPGNLHHHIHVYHPLVDRMCHVCMIPHALELHNDVGLKIAAVAIHHNVYMQTSERSCPMSRRDNRQVGSWPRV